MTAGFVVREGKSGCNCAVNVFGCGGRSMDAVDVFWGSNMGRVGYNVLAWRRREMRWAAGRLWK